MSKRNIVVTEASGQYIEDLPVEIVERKGIGHPDSLCDGIAERISVEYCRWCLENLGTLLHHNFDKVQLVAGEVEVGFGGGHMIRPIRIQIAGRAPRRIGAGRFPWIPSPFRRPASTSGRPCAIWTPTVIWS